MSDGLGIGCYEIVLVVREVDMTRTQRRHDRLDEPDLLFGCAMRNDDERLTFW